nr:zinc finger, CCHC-type [Tanacetum cinerariifolium]GFA55665.1 zinc finger, CCHC-type [Tanacetum cinerariifolium]
DYKLNYLEHPIPATPVPAHAGQQVPTEAFAAYVAWVKGEKETVGLILMTMEPDIQHNMENLGAYDMLQELKTLFFQQVEQELLQTVREFHACKQEDQSLSSYVFKMKIYIENLECLGHPVLLNLAVSLILVSLRKEYDRFVQNYNMHGMRNMVNELHAMLKLHEQSLPKNDARALHAIRAGKVQKKIYKNKNSQLAAMGNNQGKGKSKLDYAPKPKIPPSPKNKNLAKDSNKKLSQGASTSGIFTIELYSFLGKYWVYDTGCGTHICNTTQGLRGSRKLKPGALSLYMGNDQRTAVKAIGSFHLCFPSGLVVIFHNFHYAPSITRGIISVSCLDGIYEIDSSNSNTNNSSMYDVTNKRANLNLESTLLWHYRLGHISKKRIEKLQHDGLLNSTDNQYFDKCVSCMSGNMARKPYSHQVEKG